MNVRRLKLVLGLAAVVATAGACSINTGGTTQSEKKLDCGDVKLAYIGPLSGSSRTFGTTAYDAAKLALADFQKAHPDCRIGGFERFDSQGDPGQAPALAQKAVSDKDVVGVIGPGFSGEVKAAMPILNEAGLPAITSSATNADLSKQGWKYFHRTVGNDDIETTGLTDYLAHNRKVKTVAVVDNGQAYGKGSADLFVPKAKKLGLKIVMHDSVDAANQDYSSTVIAINAKHPQAVFCGCLYPEAGRLVKQLRSANSKAMFVAPAGTYSSDFVSNAGRASAEGAYVSAASAPIGRFTGYAKFAAAWKKAYGTVPDVYAPEAYDAMTAYLRAIQAGKRSRPAINTWLSTAHFDGLSGPVAFASNGDVVRDKVTIYRVRDGQFAFADQVAVPNG